MKKFFGKTGQILFCTLPVLLAFGIQLAVSSAAVLVKIVLLILEDPSIMGDMTVYMNSIYSVVEDSQFLAAVSAVYAVIAALALGFWYWKKFAPRKAPRRKLSQLIHPQMLLGLLLLMVGMQFLSTYIVALTSAIHPAWYETYSYLMESMGFENVTLLLVLYSVVIAPISEELIFRGVTLHYARKAMPFFAANMLQAFFFGLFHGNVIQGTYAFVVGLFCGYVCHKGGSIYLAILFHMLFNMWGTFMPGNIAYSGDSIVIHVLIFLVVCAVAALGFYLYSAGAAKRNSIEGSTVL